MNEYLKGLREDRAELLREMEQMLDKAESRGGSKVFKNTAEQRAYDAKFAEAERLTSLIEVEERKNEECIRAILERDGDAPTAPGGLTPSQRRLAFNSWCRVGSTLQPTREGLEFAERAGFAPGCPMLNFDMRSMGVGETTKGAKAVPQGFLPTLEIARKAYGSVRNVARIISTDSGEDLRLPTTDDTSNEGRILPEFSQAEDQDITISEMVLGSFMFDSDVVLVSTQLLQDAGFDLESHIAELLGERLYRAQNRYLTVGTGTAQPNGVVTAATVGETAASQTAVTYGELVDLMHSVDPAYQEGAKWMLNWTTAGALMKLEDDNGRPLWQPAMDAGFANGMPARILGHEVVINQAMPNMVVGQRAILYGEFRKYCVREVGNLQVMRLNERYADRHMVGFLAFHRVDGDLLDAGQHPVKALVMAS